MIHVLVTTTVKTAKAVTPIKQSPVWLFLNTFLFQITHRFHRMLHTKGQLVANIKDWSTALSVVSKLSSAVIKQLLVNVVHYIYTAIKEKPYTSTKELTWLIMTSVLVILTGQQVNHHLKFTRIKAYCVVTFCCNDGQNQHWGNYIRTETEHWMKKWNLY